MQAYAFSRTSGARNPIVIVKIFIFIFLQPKVVLHIFACTITLENTFLPITPKPYVGQSKQLNNQIR